MRMKNQKDRGTPNPSSLEGQDFGDERLKAEIAGRLKAVLAESGGQKAFGEAKGISTATIANYAGGRSEPKPSFLKAVSEHTGVSIHWLVTGKGPKYTGSDASRMPFDPARMRLASKIAAALANDGSLPEGYDQHSYATALYEVLTTFPPAGE